MLSCVVVRAHTLQLLRPLLAPAAVWMAAEIEPLCDGCPFRCDGCPWDWMDEDIEPQLLLARDRQARRELGLDEDMEADLSSHARDALVAARALKKQKALKTSRYKKN